LRKKHAKKYRLRTQLFDFIEKLCAKMLAMIRCIETEKDMTGSGLFRAQRLLSILVASFLMPATVLADSYAFAPAPTTSLNRLYRVDRISGEVIACQFAIDDKAPNGLTLCYPASDGAKAGTAGDYALIASNHQQEAGIFRVNRRTGDVSICYVRNDQEVVCTAPVR
jgi:hypothetical protein